MTLIFSVGIVVFALTIWGAIMAGSMWLGQVAESQNERSASRAMFTEPKAGPNEASGGPETSSQ